MATGLEIKNLTVTRDGREILTNVFLDLHDGEVILLSGQNGVGKSTLALTIMGHPGCVVTAGSIMFGGNNIADLATYERARLGIFLAHQEPPVIQGVSVVDVLRVAAEAKEGSTFTIPKFQKEIREALAFLSLDYAFAKREMNAQFSGGEKKRVELLSLLLLRPKLALLDEIDSGMDVETRTLVLKVIEILRKDGTAFLIISHQQEVFAGLEGVRRMGL